MIYSNLQMAVADLEKNGMLVRVKETLSTRLDLATVHLKVYEAGGPALLFENVQGCKYPVVSNLFGSLERSKFLFRNTLEGVEKVISLKNDPASALKKPFAHIGTGLAAWKALPKKSGAISDFNEISISELPQIVHWPMDGGAFITLPQVYSEDPDKPGIMNANLGMYRVQLSGNDYVKDEEIGLHYQINRGIGIHQQKANRQRKPLKVSIFVGGPPAHTVAAVMPLPEGLSEATFAGLLAGRRFRYFYHEGFCISADADFVITGEISGTDTKPEGPFGDHLGYYSLTHLFPVMKIHRVFARKNAIWPFTVVGRPPQEDTSFGQLIHEMTGSAIKIEIPGVQEVHAVDAAGVHPLLLAIGSERYTPFADNAEPAEILTQANRILGTGQLSLAKYLWITAGSEVPDINDIEAFMKYMLCRLDWRRDLHFQTNTTIDTLDYSGTGLNKGSKLILSAYGSPVRNLTEHWELDGKLVLPGVIALNVDKFSSYEHCEAEMKQVENRLVEQNWAQKGVALVIICDDASFTAASLNNFLWVTFTRSNPSHDVYGAGSFIKHKHWGCTGPLIIDARLKPHHAPPLVPDAHVEKKIQPIFEKGGSLYGKL